MSRKVSLILSSVCPGLGQIYKGEVAKGFSLALICALLIISISISSIPVFLSRFSIIILLLLWFIGMLDAYVDNEFLMARKKTIFWQRVIIILSFVFVTFSIIDLMMLWTLQLSSRHQRMFINANNEMAESDTQEQELKTGLNAHFSNRNYFSIQVAAFGDQEKAAKIRQDLITKGYVVDIEEITVKDKIWYRILVGKFPSEEEAKSFSEKLHKQEGYTDMIIRNRSPQN